MYMYPVFGLKIIQKAWENPIIQDQWGWHYRQVMSPGVMKQKRKETKNFIVSSYLTTIFITIVYSK